MSEKEKPTCFIIMPITTPESYREKYRDSKDHFDHVLNCLFIPALEKADYEALSPIAKGSDLIHAGIIENLEKSDLVLCDMSCLNPNVFFEFGIRTALDKPVCIVKDEYTKSIPFDTGILNYQEYRSSLDSWYLTEEIDKLVEHINQSKERSKGSNTLWKYFGLKTSAKPVEKGNEIADQLSFLSMRLDSIQNLILENNGDSKEMNFIYNYSEKVFPIIEELFQNLPGQHKIHEIRKLASGNIYVNYFGDQISEDEEKGMTTNFKLYGNIVKFRRLGPISIDTEIPF